MMLPGFSVQSGTSGEGLGWVDLHLGSSPGWWADTEATYCPSRMVEHPKSKSTQPSPSPDAPDCRSAKLRTCNENFTQNYRHLSASFIPYALYDE